MTFYGTQGGGKAVPAGDRFRFIEDPKCPGLSVGDLVPEEWGVIGPFNDDGTQAPDPDEAWGFFSDTRDLSKPGDT